MNSRKMNKVRLTKYRTKKLKVHTVRKEYKNEIVKFTYIQNSPRLVIQ